MATSQKMKDDEKAALQDELKYYSGLLAAHYRSKEEMRSQDTNAQTGTSRNNAVFSNSNTYKTSSNYVHHFKSNSFHPRTVTHLPNQNSNYTLNKKLDLSSKFKVTNSLDLRQNLYKSSMVKVNPSTFSCKSIKPAAKPLGQSNLLKSNILGSSKQMNPIIANIPSESKSRVLDEIIELTKQLKQKTKHIDSKVNHVSQNAHALNKCMLHNPKLKMAIKEPIVSTISCKTLNNISRTTNMEDQSCNGSLSPLSKSSSSCLSVRKRKISQVKPSEDVNDPSVKPLSEFKKNLLQPNEENAKILTKPLNETSLIMCGKLENPDDLKVNTPVTKTPARKKLIKKRISSAKKLSGATLFASKYKVVNRNVQQGNKVTLISPEIKTPLKIKSVVKHINSVKKVKGRARLITTKYKIVNKKVPCVQSLNFEKSFQGNGGDNKYKLSINDKGASVKTNGVKLKATKLNSKYKIVNKNEKSVTVSASLFAKKSINTKESRLGHFIHQGSKNFNKFSSTNSFGKNIYFTSKLFGERKIIRSMNLAKQNHLHALKQNKHKLSRNSFISNSKYKTVNRRPCNSMKKISETFSSDQNSGMDIDLLMELAAEKKQCNDLVTNPSSKHILIKRVYKSKNTIVNKNVSSLQTKVAKMIKTKYSIFNKKHSWKNQSFTKRIFSPKSFKDYKFNRNYQMRTYCFHSQRHKRNNSQHRNRPHVSTYFAGRSYSRDYRVSNNKSIAAGSRRLVLNTPKRFVLNRKMYTKTPNTIKMASPVSKTMASRALNRSINRVLSASAKKKTSKVNIYCMFYNRFGRCNKGIKCPYVHDPSKIAVCTRFLRGTCKIDNCLFSHEICPGKMAICSFFLLGSCTKTNCPYRHETLSPNAKLCKAFVQGYCPDGKQCKQAHILVCPQFVQGHCEKGDECPFPHPPPKENKTISNSSEKTENLEETEELLFEKVSRYFESANETVTNDKTSVNSVLVSRSRNLPVQPAFIAL